MVEHFIFLTEGMKESEIDLSSARLRNFFLSLEVNFLNQAIKLINVILHVDDGIFMVHEQSNFYDISLHSI